MSSAAWECQVRRRSEIKIAYNLTLRVTIITAYSQSIYLWLNNPFVGPWSLFSFFIHTQSVRLLRRGISPWQATTYTQNKRTQTSMPSVGFEPTIPAFELAKRVHASSHAANVMGPTHNHYYKNLHLWLCCPWHTEGNDLIFNEHMRERIMHVTSDWNLFNTDFDFGRIWKGNNSKVGRRT
jgi:hypothetical protein